MNFVKTVIASAAIAFAGQAFAQDGENNIGGSNLFLGIWDAGNSQAFIVDTGVDFESVFSLNGVVTSFDTSVLSDNFEWQVFAFDNNVLADDVADAGRRLFTSIDSVPALPADVGFDAADMENVIGNIELVTSTDPNNIQGFNGTYTVVADFDASVTGFGATEFALFDENYIRPSRGSDFRDQDNPYNVVDAGFGLEFASNGDLIATGANPIPLPAAAWLMISAIAGLGGVARRRA